MLDALSSAIDRFYDSESGTFGEGYDHFHNAAGQATLVKAAMEDIGLPSQVFGTDALPEGTQHPENSGEGYDWIVVDNRWVVDLWVRSYWGTKYPVVYDMKDPKQLAAVIQNFGPLKTWEKLKDYGPEMDTARRIWHEFKLPYNAVDDLLNSEG